jgi:hypothetical protein
MKPAVDAREVIGEYLAAMEAAITTLRSRSTPTT